MRLSPAWLELPAALRAANRVDFSAVNAVADRTNVRSNYDTSRAHVLYNYLDLKFAPREFLYLRRVGKRGEATDCAGMQGADAFGDLINGGEEFFVLCLEGRVQGEETRPLDVPMRQMRQGNQGVGIGKDLIQASGKARVGFGC